MKHLHLTYLALVLTFLFFFNEASSQCTTTGSESTQDVALTFTCSNQTLNAIGVNSQRRYTGITAEEWYTFNLGDNGNSTSCKKGRFMNGSNTYLGNEFDISENITIQAPTGASKINITSSGTWSSTSTVLAYRKASPTANIKIETDYTGKACVDQDIELTANWGPFTDECVRFDGENNERVDIPNNDINDSGGSNMSFEVWFRVNDKSLSRKQIIFEQGGGTNGINFYIQSNTLYAAMWSETTGWADQRFSTTSFNSNQWYHVAIVLESATTVRAYLDGEQFGTGSVAANMNAHSGENGIGSQHNGTEFHDNEGTAGDGTYNFSGDIADLRIWTIARSQQQIYDNMYSDMSGTTGLLNNYTLDGTLADAEGNEANGSFVDDAEYKDVFNFDNYDWSNSAGAIGSSTQTVTVSSPAPGGVYDVSIDLNGCTDLSSGDAFINVLPNVTPSNQVTLEGESAYCLGEDLELDTRFMAPGGEWVDFDGDDDYVSLPNILNGVTSFSISMWFKRDADLYSTTSTNHAIGNTLFSHSSNTNNDNFELGTNGEIIDVYLDTDGGTDFKRSYEGGGIENGVWYYLVFTYDQTNANIYLDGKLLESKTDWNGQIDQVNQTSTVNLGIARGGNNNWGDFDGSIDEFRFFTSALTEAQVQDLMYTEMNLSHPNWGTLNTYFDFNDDVDDRKNSNDGTLTGGANLSTADYYTYDWTGPNAYSSSTSDTSITIASASLAMTGLYEVTISDENSCDILTADKELTVFPNFPSLNVTKDTIACVDTDVSFESSGLVPGGQYATFNGTSGHVHLPISYSAVTSISETTVEAWFNTSFVGGVDDNWAIFDLDRNEFFNVYVEGSGNIGFNTTSSAVTHDWESTSSGYNDGNWHHVAAVYDGTDKFIYVDGELIESISNPHGGADLGASGDIRFAIIGDGSEASSLLGSGNNIFYDGSLDEVRYYEAAVGANTIREWMYKEVDASHPNWSDLQGYYQFNGNYDDSKNSNDGTPQGGITFNAINDFYTYNWSGPNAYSNTVADTLITLSSVTLVDTGYYVAEVSGDYCNTELGKDSAKLDVLAESNNVYLVDGATQIATVEQCEENGWTYYTTVANPDRYVFAIKKNSNVFTAEVTLTDLPGTSTYSSTGGVGPDRGTWLIGRYWNAEVTEGSISTTVDIRFFIDAAELTQADNEASAFVNNTAFATTKVGPTFFKTTGIDFDPNSGLASGNFTFTPTYLPFSVGTINSVAYIEMTGLTGFSGGTGGYSVNDDGSTLPVELLSFEATNVKDEFIQLDWKTATEINNSGFEIQRSTTGRDEDFKTIQWVEGNGNSVEVISYEYRDLELANNTVYYYRLRQVDFDGQFEFSNVRAAKLLGNQESIHISLFPNPVNDGVFTLETNIKERYSVSIINTLGQVVSMLDVNGEPSTEIHIENLEPGLYQVVIRSQNKSSVKKIIVGK